MISDAELEVLARGLETERLERKRKLSSQKTKVEEAICAYGRASATSVVVLRPA